MIDVGRIEGSATRDSSHDLPASVVMRYTLV
jgi:hypothetical protein